MKKTILFAALLAVSVPALAQAPKGRVENGSYTSTKWFPGTTRSLNVYIPAQYDSKKPACVMVFQDGGGFDAARVFDELIAKGEMPVTIGIFITPGVVPNKDNSALPRYNRSYEYDSPTDRYARFLIDEILPEVGKKYNLSKDPNDHAIAGASSGGIAAFTAAFFRPDAFRRVFSVVGSYTDLRGATHYGAMVRKFEPKPLRLFMQENDDDQDIYSGSWPDGNKDLEDGLKFARYNYQYVWGKGGHNGSNGGKVFPDALRFIWKDWPAPITLPTDTPQPVTKLITPGVGWDRVGLPGLHAMDAHGVQAITTGPQGMLYAVEDNNLTSLSGDGPLRMGVGATNAMAFTPDGTVLLAQPKQVVALDLKANKTKTLLKTNARGIVVGKNGNAYVTSADGKVWLIPAKGMPKVVAEGVEDPTGVTLVPDQTLLMVSSGTGRYVWSWQVQSDGTLAFAQPYHEINVIHGESKSQAGGMVTDTNGWLYLASPYGIQVLDQAGRVNSILVNPNLDASAQLTWSGSTLYCLSGGRLFARKTKATGVQPWESPLKPPAPRL